MVREPIDKDKNNIKPPKRNPVAGQSKPISLEDLWPGNEPKTADLPCRLLLVSSAIEKPKTN
jgi:hypothetical protein